MIKEETVGMTKHGASCETQYHVGTHKFYTLFSESRGSQWLTNTVIILEWAEYSEYWMSELYIFTSSSIWWTHQWKKNSPWMGFQWAAPQHCSLGTFCKAHFLRVTKWWATCVAEETRVAPSFLGSHPSSCVHIRTWDVNDTTIVFDQEGTRVSNLYQASKLDGPCSDKHREVPLPLEMCGIYHNDHQV